MVDANRRKQLAELLQHFVAGQMTNDEFEDKSLEIIKSSKDAALLEIRDEACCLYSDTHEYRLRGRYSIEKDGCHQIAHWIAFLHSEFEYEWPKNRISWIKKALGLMIWLGLLLATCVFVVIAMYFGMSLAFYFPRPYSVWLGYFLGALSFISAGLLVIYIWRFYATYCFNRLKQKCGSMVTRISGRSYEMRI
ncbi:MAG: hypothetical protein A2Y07_03780 [Planctomycetes bacterium GWF2_50_10]|nr:MAG: hypothetical protein A2Y07_03780 [Planctomycetes bacterium GWF2_50_10]